MLFLSKRKLSLCFFYFFVSFAYSQTPQYIYFSGFKWFLKENSTEQIGPGPNFFSAAPVNLSVDPEGHLNMSLTKNKDKKWYCAELVTDSTFGYGTYIFELGNVPSIFNKNIVLGLFVYDFYKTPAHNEIDIEFSKWGRRQKNNVQFVLHQDTNYFDSFRFHQKNLRNSTHTFSWYPDSIVYRSYMSSISNNISAEPYMEYVLKNTNIPEPSNEKVRINLWLYKGRKPFRKKHTVVIKSFKFIPMSL
ncbi:MAG: family 16 glycosylhydrolase [Bacteroidales bacterium]|nr:family 16 glycosylhydrolase [Bacteroidales bacterium]